MNLFGTKKKEAPKLGEAIQKLRTQQDVLEKREKHLEKMKTECIAMAQQKLRAKDKKGALFQLKRKKMFDKQIDQISNTRTNLEMQAMTIESAGSAMATVEAMSYANQTLKELVSDQKIDKVNDVMEDLEEHMQQGQELSDALSRQVGPEMDNDELLSELDLMEQEMTESDLLAAPVIPEHRQRVQPDQFEEKKEVVQPAPVREKDTRVPITLGSGGNAPKPQVKSKEDKELEDLNALMGM